MALANITNNVLTDSGTSLSSLATQTYVGTQIANLVASSPTTLDTLNELATALGNDPNFATTVSTSIGNRVPYTSATANVNLGIYNLDGGNININGGGSGGGALRLKQFAGSEANREGYNSISTLTSGVFYFTSSASVPNFKNFALNPSGLTDNTLRTYTLPDASGTLALTSNLSSYLPLVGGTLTGALSGTSATFSGTIGTAGDITITKASDASFIVNNTSASGKSFRLVSKDDGRFYIQNTGVADLFNITSTGAATFSNIVSASAVRSINGGVDGTYQDAFVGVYSSNNNEQNAIQTAVSSSASQSGFRFQVSNGGGSSLRTTMMTITRSNLSVSNEVIVGAQGGTDTTYISGGSGYGSVIRNIYAGGSVNNELRGNGNNYFNVLLGSMGVGTNNPQYTLDVNGSGRFVGALYANNTIYGTRIIGGNLIAGNMASNMPTSPSYILIVNINDIAGFSMSGKVNAASYTCWNISDIWIEKDYSSTVVRAGIEGKYKSGCDFSIVDISYGAGRYVAFRFTSNPEVDVLLTGFRLTDQVSGGSFQVITSGVTVNGTYASY